MKVEKNRILLNSCLPTGTYHKNLAIWIDVSSNYGEFGLFFPWKMVCVGQNERDVILSNLL
jgi:hypothetical protein